MRNGFGVEAQFADRFDGLSVIVFVHRVREEKLGASLRGIDLQGDGDGGADQYSLVAFFGDHQGSFLDPETTAQARRDDDRSAFADFAGFDVFHRRLIA